MAEYANSTGEPLAVQEERKQYGKEKPKAKDTARLIWASKPRREPSAKDLEFQTAEEVYPNIVDLENKKLSSFVTEKKEISEQPNRLIWGDNLLVMQALLAQGYEGQIDLIYIDPPFNSGEDYNFTTSISIGDVKYDKEIPVQERLAYTDTWIRGVDSFLDMLYPRLQLAKKLLSDKGSIYIHCDSSASHYIRLILDEIFGRDKFINEIIWQRKRSQAWTSDRFGVTNDTIFYYSNKNKHTFNPTFSKDDPATLKYIKERFRFDDGDGRKYMKSPLVNPLNRPNLKYEFYGVKPPKTGWLYSKERMEAMFQNNELVMPKDKNSRIYRKIFLDEYKGQMIQNIWTDIPIVNPMAKERLDYDTQKPEALLKRIIESSSNKDDLVADFFCGSGTTAAVAEKLGRKWITSDLSKTAIQVTRGRLVNENTDPFLIENLGNYQRQLIYAKEVNLKQMYNIILKLYGATPRKDWQGFGISKDDKKALVYVCEPDRPMTGKKALELAKAAKTADGKGYKNLVILAWDYEYDFDDIYRRLAKSARKGVVKAVEFKIIPSDVYKYLRSTKVGDLGLANKITFYQKPYLRLSEPQTKSINPNEVKVEIKIERYVVMDIPVKDESKRPEIEKMLHKNFANMLDYWTVDWDYDGEVFRSTWQAIKDRKSSEPVPVLADTVLKKGKKYTIAVRVVDVFGNDASMTKEVDLR